MALLVRDDLDTVWEIIGGVKTRGFTFDNPVEDTTSSSTVGDYQDSEFTGYSQASLDVAGVADKRTGIVDPASGLTVVGSGRLVELATTGNRCGKFKMLNLDSNGFIEGYFTITSFAKTGDVPGLLNFTATLQNKSDVIVSGEV